MLKLCFAYNTGKRWRKVNCEYTYIHTNSITLHTVMAGPKEGPLVILLHGFPEFWYGWRFQIEALAKAGYRVVVPDQRGYNLSEKPQKIESYTIDILRDDILGLLSSLQRKKAIFIGHDWGGLVAWHIATTDPLCVEKLIILNSPQPHVMVKVVSYLPIQWYKSFYLLLFQPPFLPEWAFRNQHFQLFETIMEKTSRNGTFTTDDFAVYKTAWSQKQALTTMVHWYRAMRKGTIKQVKERAITVPVRIIWGKDDVFLSLSLAKKSIEHCVDCKLVLVDATHWVHLEQPQLVNKFLLEFIAE
ncbi:alpha/beta fold hydrolase [Alkalihalobacterium bogoriense]|uniref:alpha/beta fold hydrolase n=1 Tax=Alkalihalobacterium bogoriense TaxID=246272 RepID=UPI000688E491|nr:alpha/beta hydrolase [Alkalihalobacterium bogoriense]